MKEKYSFFHFFPFVNQPCKNSHHHMTADVIYETLKKDNPALSLGTVYRNLNQLADHEMIQKISIPGHPDRFDATTHNHFHFYCTSCHDIKDLFFEGLYEAAGLVEKETGARIDHSDMSFHGLCADCKDVAVN